MNVDFYCGVIAEVTLRYFMCRHLISTSESEFLPKITGKLFCVSEELEYTYTVICNPASGFFGCQFWMVRFKFRDILETGVPSAYVLSALVRPYAH